MATLFDVDNVALVHWTFLMPRIFAVVRVCFCFRTCFATNIGRSRTSDRALLMAFSWYVSIYHTLRALLCGDQIGVRQALIVLRHSKRHLMFD